MNQAESNETIQINRLWKSVDIILIPIIFIVLLVGIGVLIQVSFAEEPSRFVMLILGVVSIFVAGVGSVFLVNTMGTKHTLSDLGFCLPDSKWWWTAAILALSLMIFRLVLMYFLFEMFPALEASADEVSESFQTSTVIQSIVFGILGAIVVPIGEEVFFRGFVHNALRNKFGMWASIVISSFVFALAHGNLTQSIAVFFAGLCLAWLYEKSGSLWTPIFAHGLNNGLAIAMSVILVA